MLAEAPVGSTHPVLESDVSIEFGLVFASRIESLWFDTVRSKIDLVKSCTKKLDIH